MWMHAHSLKMLQAKGSANCMLSMMDCIVIHARNGYVRAYLHIYIYFFDSPFVLCKTKSTDTQLLMYVQFHILCHVRCLPKFCPRIFLQF